MPKQLSARQVFTNPLHLLAFGFGSGLLPKAPGTAGTVVGVLVYLLLLPLPHWAYWLATLLLFAAGIYICGYSAAALGAKDPGAVNWDEIVGYLCSMGFAPRGWPWVILGFVLFRGFDILKPWPIRWFDRKFHGGLGIMLDDVVAAVPCAVIIYIVALLLKTP
ncbi:MAG: phosphatidylglycerophosphatase A [Gammaproteobacteria bacterium]|nr:phosphatidylglycerophosphatase A [Gammaproteobacteria bacterium]MDE2345176.1 phosphatidylglycerophosphatase A [Gammaproteobacteria bacterium]